MMAALDSPFLLIFDMTAVRSAVAVTPSDSAVLTPGRLLAVVCTVAGNVAVQFPDGSQIIVPVAVGLTHLPYAAAKVLATGTTATASFAILQ